MKRVVIVYFSPTHTTQKVLRAIAEGLDSDTLVEIDLTTDKKKYFKAAKGDILLVGTPVHSGRVPKNAVDRLVKIKGKGHPAICVSVYGNNKFGNALVELTHIVEKNGFIAIAGAGFVGEHSFATGKRIIANGRPNSEDLEKGKEFGRRVRTKMDNNKVINLRKLRVVNIPGELPTKPNQTMPKMASKATETCNNCGVCIKACPVGAIGDDLVCDSEKCIQCFACVKACPIDARELKHPILSIAAFALSKVKDKEPEIFI